MSDRVKAEHRKVRREEFRVVVYPRHPGGYGYASSGGMTQTEEEWERDCRKIKDQITRNIDGIAPHGVCVEWDNKPVCGFCGADWTEGEDSPHNGGCCDKDAEILERMEADDA